jgi:uncharacterized membrane protein YhaH (DUF805 family)
MRRSARGRRTLLSFVLCWAIPGAGFCTLAFSGGFAAGQPIAPDPWWLAGPAGGVLAVLAVVYAFFWLCLPVLLLAVGIRQLRAMATWRWAAIWAGTVVAGIALDPLGLWAINTTFAGDGFQWTRLAATLGYLGTGAAMTAILIAGPRSNASASPATGVNAA